MNWQNDYPQVTGLVFDSESQVVRRVHRVRGLDLRCHKSSSSSSQASNQTTQTVSGAGSPSTTGNRSPVTTNSGLLQLNGATKGDLNIDGTTYKAGGNITITQPSDTAAIANAFQTALGTVSATSGGSDAQLSQALAGQNALLQSALAQSANYTSGGQTNANKTVLWIVGIIAAVIGLFVWRKKVN
jgi:hypothetical protein